MSAPSPRSLEQKDLSARAWRNAVFSVFGLTGFVFASWAARVPEVRDLLNASTEEVGLLITGLALGALLGLLASSHVVSLLGATNTIRVFYSVAGAAMIGVAVTAQFAAGFALLFLLLAVFGAGQSVTDVAMNLSGAANERVLGRNVMPLFHAAFSLGTVVGAGVAALTLLWNVPIGIHLGLVGALAIAVVALSTRALRPAEHRDSSGAAVQAQPWRARVAVWVRPRVLLIGLIVLGSAFAEGAAQDWLSLAMVDGHGMDHAAGAAVFAVFVAAMTASRLGGVLLLDRFGRVPVLRGSALLAIAGLILVITVPVVWVAVIGVVLWGLGAALGFPVGMSAAADDPRTATAMVSAVATIGYSAFLIGPPIIGYLGEQFGLLNALTAVLVLLAIAGSVAGAARTPAVSTFTDVPVPA